MMASNDQLTPDPEMLALAEAMLAAYKLAAYSNTDGISHSQSPVYRTTKRALITILGQLSGNGYRAFMLYSLWLDNGESIAYNYQLAADAGWRRSAFRIAYEMGI